MTKNFDDVLYGRINEKLEEKLNCTVPFLPAIESKLTGNITKICETPNQSLKAVREYDYLRASGQSTIGDTPCTGMDIYLGLPFISKTDKNVGYIKLYLKSTVKIKSTVLDYQFLSLVAELGGYVGLLLGISCVKILITLNSVFMRNLEQKIVKCENNIK